MSVGDMIMDGRYSSEEHMRNVRSDEITRRQEEISELRSELSGERRKSKPQPAQPNEAKRALLDEGYSALGDESFIESIIAKPVYCYLAGRQWGKCFDTYANQIIEAVVNDHKASCLAGAYWNDERFNLAANEIAAAVATDAHSSLYAGTYWNDDRFNRYAKQIVKGVKKTNNQFARIESGRQWGMNTERPIDRNECLNAGRYWNDDRFNRFAKEIVKELGLSHVTDNGWINGFVAAGMYWNDDRFNRFEKQIVENISSYYDVAVGRYWNDNRFNRFAEKIMDGLLWQVSYYRDTADYHQALKQWNKERKTTLMEYAEKRGYHIKEKDE